MKQKQINSQLSNFNTSQMYLRQCLTLAENVFEIDGLPEFLDVSYINKCLLRNGSIAWFYDEILGLLALPYRNVTTLDVYGRPRRIEVYAKNGAYTRTLNSDEFVIMYDNNGRYPLFLDILQYSERLALCTRVCDINIMQQKTPRIWKTKTNQELSLKRILNDVDSFENSVLTYDNINLDDTECVLAPAPYIADKVEESKDKIWSEFLRLIGISNLSYTKKERNIRDEIQAMQGGTIASRYSRFEPRKNAIDKINKMFGDKLEKELSVKYYDGLPSSIKDTENMFDINNEEKEEKTDV